MTPEELQALLAGIADPIQVEPPDLGPVRLLGERRRRNRVALTGAGSAVALAGVVALVLTDVSSGVRSTPPPQAAQITTSPQPSVLPTPTPAVGGRRTTLAYSTSTAVFTVQVDTGTGQLVGDPVQVSQPLAAHRVIGADLRWSPDGHWLVWDDEDTDGGHHPADYFIVDPTEPGAVAAHVGSIGQDSEATLLARDDGIGAYFDGIHRWSPSGAPLSTLVPALGDRPLQQLATTHDAIVGEGSQQADGSLLLSAGQIKGYDVKAATYQLVRVTSDGVATVLADTPTVLQRQNSFGYGPSAEFAAGTADEQVWGARLCGATTLVVTTHAGVAATTLEVPTGAEESLIKLEMSPEGDPIVVLGGCQAQGEQETRALELRGTTWVALGTDAVDVATGPSDLRGLLGGHFEVGKFGQVPAGAHDLRIISASGGQGADVGQVVAAAFRP